MSLFVNTFSSSLSRIVRIYSGKLRTNEGGTVFFVRTTSEIGISSLQFMLSVLICCEIDTPFSAANEVLTGFISITTLPFSLLISTSKYLVFWSSSFYIFK